MTDYVWFLLQKINLVLYRWAGVSPGRQESNPGPLDEKRELGSQCYVAPFESTLVSGPGS